MHFDPPAPGILIPSGKRMVESDPQKINQRQVWLKLFKENMLQTSRYIKKVECSNWACCFSAFFQETSVKPSRNIKVHAFSRSHSHTAFATLLRLVEVSSGAVWKSEARQPPAASALQCSKFPIDRLQLFFTLGPKGPKWPKMAQMSAGLLGKQLSSERTLQAYLRPSECQIPKPKMMQ